MIIYQTAGMFLDRRMRTAPAHTDVQDLIISAIGIMIREMITITAETGTLETHMVLMALTQTRLRL